MSEDVIQSDDSPSRSTRAKRPPNLYGEWVNTVVFEEPSTVNEAVSSPNCTEWKCAMKQEIDSINRNDVWNLVELPAG